MKNSHYQELMNNLEQLGLTHMREYVPNYIEVVNREELSLTEALLELTRQEVVHQNRQRMARVVDRARFPKQTSLEEFDFAFQPSTNKREILDLKHMGFVEKHENLVFIGSPGVGKTHLTIALGIEACHQSNTVYPLSRTAFAFKSRLRKRQFGAGSQSVCAL